MTTLSETTHLIDRNGKPVGAGDLVRDDEGRYSRVVKLSLVPTYEKDTEGRSRVSRPTGDYDVDYSSLSVEGHGDGISSLLVGPDSINLRGNWSGSVKPAKAARVDDPVEIREYEIRGIEVEKREIDRWISHLTIRRERLDRELDAIVAQGRE